MSRWFRHYAGLARDEKLVKVAVRTKQPVERVVWVWVAILESAAEINDAGRYEFDAGEAAYFLRSDCDELLSVEAALADCGRLARGVVARWGERQYSSDSSAERQRRYRQRKAAHSEVRTGEVNRNGDGGVTSRDGAVTPQRQIQIQKEEEPNGSLSETGSDGKPEKPRRKKRAYPPDFDAAWIAYPTDPNMSKADAFDAWKRLDAADKDALAASIPAFVAYCRAHPDYRPKHMVGYIKSRRFDGHGQQQPAPSVDDDTWRKRLEFGRRQQTWSTGEWGPRPGLDGCMVPLHLVQPGDGQDWREWERHAA